MVETDKATSDAPSPAAGVLARVLGEGGGYRRGREGVALLAETAAGIEAAKTWSGGAAADGAVQAPADDASAQTASPAPAPRHPLMAHRPQTASSPRPGPALGPANSGST